MSGEKGYILKVRDKDGKFVDIPAIKGRDAYEYAVDGGFAGTEADFIQILNENLAEFDGGHIVDKNNPHGTTAEQVVALKIYSSIEAFNEENNTNFVAKSEVGVNTTDIATIIKAMPENTGLIMDVNDFYSPTKVYPVDYGILSIYKIRENRVTVEYVSNISVGVSGYNRRWVGQYNAGVFGGFQEVFTEAHPPTAEQVGAISESVKGYNNVKINFLLGDHNKLKDVDETIPTLPDESNFMHLYMIQADEIVSCLSIPIDYSKAAYYYTASDKKWRKVADASQFLPIVGGTISGDFGTLQNSDNWASMFIGHDLENRAVFTYHGGILYVSSVGNDKTTMLTLTSDGVFQLQMPDGSNKNIFGEHNKPTQTYNGLASESKREIAVGGTGRVAIITNDSTDSSIGNNVVIAHGNGAWVNGSPYSKDVINFKNGVLTISINNKAVNAGSVTYYCQVL